MNRETGIKSDLHFIEANTKIAFDHQSLITQETDHRAASWAMPADGGDHGFGAAGKGLLQTEKSPDDGVGCRRLAHHLAHIETGGEHAGRTGQHQHSHRVILFRTQDGLLQRGNELGVQRIHGRAVELQDATGIMIG